MKSLGDKFINFLPKTKLGLISFAAVIFVLLVSSIGGAFALSSNEKLEEPSQEIAQPIRSIDPVPTGDVDSSPGESSLPDNSNEIEVHSYGFHNSGCPEGNSLYQVGNQNFTIIHWEFISPSCALMGLNWETIVHCPHTTAWARSTDLATGITTAPQQLQLNRQCPSEPQPQEVATPEIVLPVQESSPETE